MWPTYKYYFVAIVFILSLMCWIKMGRVCQVIGLKDTIVFYYLNIGLLNYYNF